MYIMHVICYMSCIIYDTFLFDNLTALRKQSSNPKTFKGARCLCMYMYIYIYIYTHVCVYIINV